MSTFVIMESIVVWNQNVKFQKFLWRFFNFRFDACRLQPKSNFEKRLKVLFCYQSVFKQIFFLDLFEICLCFAKKNRSNVFESSFKFMNISLKVSTNEQITKRQIIKVRQFQKVKSSQFLSKISKKLRRSVAKWSSDGWELLPRLYR